MSIAGAMTGKIFINYRRGDDPGHTGRLFDRLQEVFPPQQLFLDVDNIAPGLDFVRVLNERVGECDVLLAVIGKGWINASDAAGNRRLEDPEDFVRIEIVSALNQDKRVIPVLVGDATMPAPQDLPEPLRPLARRNAVRLTHERFRADTQGLVRALQQALAEIEEHNQAQARADAERRAEEERRQQQAEATRRAEAAARSQQAEEEARERRAEEEQRRQEAQAAQQAEEKARIQKAEAEARERAAEERRRREAAAKQRAAVEQAFAAARQANTVDAVEAFEASHPDSHVAAEAKTLKNALLTRREAHRAAMASDDIAALRAFCDVYRGGADVAEARARLRVLQQASGSQALRPSIVIPAALAAVVLIGAGIGYWLEHQPAPANRPVAAEPAPTVAMGPPAPAPAPSTAAPTAGPAAEAPAPVTPAPGLDQLAWSLLTDTSDEAALRRFIAEFPGSKLRKDAEARIAQIEASLAAKSAASPEEIAWGVVKDSKDPGELRKFIDEFPGSPHRGDAERLASTLSSEAKTVAVTAPDPYELTRSLQFELHRVGCFNGAVNGRFDDATKAAWHQFTKLASLNLPDDASADAIKALRAVNKRVCPLVCASGQHADGEACVANAPPPSARSPAPPAQQQRGNAVVDARTLPVGAVIPGGTTSCGPNGCIHVPKNCHAVKLGRGDPGWTGKGGHIVCP